MIKLNILFYLFLVGCAPQDNSKATQRSTIYLKQDVAELQSCSVDDDCRSDQKICVSVLNRPGRCFIEGQVGQFVGCTRGKLILVSMQPWTVDCYQAPSSSFYSP